MDYRDKETKFQVEPKGIKKIVNVLLGWIFGKQRKPKTDGPDKTKNGGGD